MKQRNLAPFGKARTGVLLAALALVLPQCAGFLVLAHDVERPAGMNCTRYTFRYERPYAGGRLGPPEKVFVYPEYAHREHPYAQCPSTASPPDPLLVKLWRQDSASRKELFHEKVASPDVAPVAIVPAAEVPVTRNIDGVTYRIETYDAFFAGCDYWIVKSEGDQCQQPPGAPQ